MKKTTSKEKEKNKPLSKKDRVIMADEINSDEDGDNGVVRAAPQTVPAPAPVPAERDGSSPLTPTSDLSPVVDQPVLEKLGKKKKKAKSKVVAGSADIKENDTEQPVKEKEKRKPKNKSKDVDALEDVDDEMDAKDKGKGKAKPTSVSQLTPASSSSSSRAQVSLFTAQLFVCLLRLIYISS